MKGNRKKIDVLERYSLESAVKTIATLEEIGYICDLETACSNGWLKRKTYFITTYRIVDNK